MPLQSTQDIPSKLRLAVLVSGRGSNLQALIDACAAPDFPAEIVCVVSNVPNVYALERAQNAGIPALVVASAPFKGQGRAAFEDALLSALAPYTPDLVCLAGFMRILSPHFLSAFEARVINIHPALLPKHKGLDTHARAIEAGDTVSGCTVHWVVPEMDSGEIIVQRSVPILPDDTPDTLAARVLTVEHIAYPQAIREIAQSRKH